jgi:hypothetical protein
MLVCHKTTDKQEMFIHNSFKKLWGRSKYNKIVADASQLAAVCQEISPLHSAEMLFLLH